MEAHVPSTIGKIVGALIRSASPSISTNRPIARTRVLMDQLGRMKVPMDVAVNRFYLEGMRAEWIRPSRAPRQKAVLYLHGGGYVMGSCASHRNLAAHLARRAGLPVLVPEYRLAPEHPFPAAVEDAAAAFRWLLKQGFLARNIVLAGDSAGGGLAVAALAKLRDEQELLPAAAVLLSPWVDLSRRNLTPDAIAEIDVRLALSISRRMAALYCGEHDPCSPFISPVYADLSGLPPMLIQVGGNEFLRDEAQKLADRARLAGVDVKLEIWPRMWHVWHFFTVGLPESKAALKAAAKFMAVHVNHATAPRAGAPLEAAWQPPPA